MTYRLLLHTTYETLTVGVYQTEEEAYNAVPEVAADWGDDDEAHQLEIVQSVASIYVNRWAGGDFGGV